MEIVLRLTPEEYNIVHKGLTKLSIEEGLNTLQKIISQAQESMSLTQNLPQNNQEDTNGRN